VAVLNEILGLHNKPKAAVHSVHKLTGPKKKKKKKNPHTVYNKHKELLQPGNLRKIQHTVLTLHIGLLFLGQ